MKTLSIKEPWLTMILDGMKTIETRTWGTHYRGDLLLVGSKTPTGNYAGKAACVVNLVDCRPMTRADEEFARCCFYSGAYSWVIDDVRPVIPFPVRGQLRLYDIPDELIEDRYLSATTSKSNREGI